MGFSVSTSNADREVLGWQGCPPSRDEDFKLGAEKVLPASAEMTEEFTFMPQEFVVAMVEGVLWNDILIHAEEVAHGALAIPLAVHVPLR